MGIQIQSCQTKTIIDKVYKYQLYKNINLLKPTSYVMHQQV